MPLDYRTQAGAEIDLVLEPPGGEVLAIEIRRTLSPKLTPGFVESMGTIRARQGVILIPEREGLMIVEWRALSCEVMK